VVKFCLDVYWLACGGEDPAAFIRKHADRAAYFHFKDGTFDAAAQKPLTFTELGRGQVDLKAATAAVREVAPEWVVTSRTGPTATRPSPPASPPSTPGTSSAFDHGHRPGRWERSRRARSACAGG
jgi:sugar phosphate isomerase/epimerase